MVSLARKITAAWSGTTPAADIETIRGKIATLKTERNAVALAPIPAAEAIALMDRMLTVWGGPPPTGLSPAELAGALLMGGTPYVDFGRTATLGATLALLSPLLRPVLRQALLDAIQARLADTPAGLPAGERAARLTALDGAILAEERAEENAIMAARAAGFDAQRRADADPRAILGLD